MITTNQRADGPGLNCQRDAGSTAKCGARNPLWMRAWHARLCAGNAEALAWLTAWWDFSAVLDDLQDKDRSVGQPEVARALFAWWTACSVNPWFAAHRAVLWQPVADSIMRWQLVDECRASGNAGAHAAGDALREADAGVFLAVGTLCGGWDHALRVLREKLLPPSERDDAKGKD